MWCSYFLLAALTVSVVPVTGYSNGKVYAACGDMMPQHGYESSTDPPPYSITVDKSTFSPGDNITVSLQVASSSLTFFKGFLIEARDAKKLDFAAGGFFILTDPRQSQLLQCGQTRGSGVSHRSSAKKTHMQAVWQSPKNPPQRVQFLVTVVHEYKVYWVRIPGPVVSLTGATAAPFTAVPVQTTSSPALSTPFSSVGCGRNKSCLRDPAGCLPQSDPRCFFLSFTTDEAGQSVMFELSGHAEGYVSFALSLDKWMGNDDVYLCVNDGSRVTISPAYVSGRKHPELAREDALRDKAWRLADGVIQCRFRRNVVLPNRFNLKKSYFLFLAHGKSDQGLIHRHYRQPLISTSQTVTTGHAVDLSGSRSPMLIKFHGVLMLSVWMWIVSTGVFIARHYRHVWPDTVLLGQRPWFQLHRTMMVLAVVLTGAAFTLPFIYRRGWSKRAGSHPYMGCAVMALCVIQPIMAIVRPAPESSRRIIFNWLHFGTGTAAQILAAVPMITKQIACGYFGQEDDTLKSDKEKLPAENLNFKKCIKVACMFLGAAQQALLLPSVWSPAVLTGWLLWIVLADLLLLIHSRRLQSRGNTSDDKEKILFAQPERRQHGEILQVKKMVLVVFLIGNTGFLTAFIKAIVSL